MEINRTTDYAVRVVMHLAQQRDGRVTSTQVAQRQGIPPMYIPKVLQTLGRAGILSTTSGRTGGVRLLRKPAELTILDIVEAMEGPILLNRCLVRQGECPRDGHCTVHRLWVRAREALLRELRATTIADLLNEACPVAHCKKSVRAQARA